VLLACRSGHAELLTAHNYMLPSDYRAATVPAQIAQLVGVAAQLAAGPSTNRRINIQPLSAHAHEGAKLPVS
jgi:hypothetical protein